MLVQELAQAGDVAELPEVEDLVADLLAEVEGMLEEAEEALAVVAEEAEAVEVDLVGELVVQVSTPGILAGITNPMNGEPSLKNRGTRLEELGLYASSKTRLGKLLPPPLHMPIMPQWHLFMPQQHLQLLLHHHLQLEFHHQLLCLHHQDQQFLLLELAPPCLGE